MVLTLRSAVACFEPLRRYVLTLTPPASKRLKGSETFRLRVGDYRVIYEVGKDFQLRILVLTVGHRRESYR